MRMETVALVSEVRALRTSSGKTRYVVTDERLGEYTTQEVDDG